ncbi:hypothetical protein [Mycobacterium spongiae]|uniref:Uncharacterized protein n=1 Tax=Mycobacterium spongiae TaxID=886343 RepID=A0A975JW92_9MYCO|nr:hypothetical protein [Mycobacterium spongiae]QUR66500.1 hypothetical protein F6B93_04815 [Mycobacterium spongiae]
MIETRHTRGIDQTLAEAAFGSQPGTWPLPAATTPHQLWLRAVAAGGQGHYGSAYHDLAVLRRRASAGPLASLAHSTHGSFLRQLGWHTLARGWDGRALAVADSDPEACADALIGLAADALGVGRLAGAATLLSRADQALAAGEMSALARDRLAVRRHWVTAELAMAANEGTIAVRHAEEAAELALTMQTGQTGDTGTGASVRHGVKSQMVLAAALCSAGATKRAGLVADDALDACGRLGLIPLRWALACLLIDIGSVTFSARELHEVRDICAGQVRRAGGSWRSA